jgi:hypothetical protein
MKRIESFRGRTFYLGGMACPVMHIDKAGGRVLVRVHRVNVWVPAEMLTYE